MWKILSNKINLKILRRGPLMLEKVGLGVEWQVWHAVPPVKIIDKICPQFVPEKFKLEIFLKAPICSFLKYNLILEDS